MVHVRRPGSRWLPLLAAALFISPLAGCSDSHDLDRGVPALRNDGGLQGGAGSGGMATAGTGPGGAPAGGTGGIFGGGTGGTPGGSGGSGGGTGGLGPGGGVSPNAGNPPVVSQDVTTCSPCPPAMGIGGALEACCTADNQCGVDVTMLTGTAMCVQQNGPGAQSSECPTGDYMGFVSVPGCCKPDGTCGVVIQQLAPLGCVSVDALGGLITTMQTSNQQGGRGGRRRNQGTPTCTPVPGPQ